jgi:hypothetical protein
MSESFKPSALKRLKDTYRSEDLILPALQRHVMKTPQLDVRPDDHSLAYMHPSDMASKDWCGRHDYYRIVGTPTTKVSSRNPSFRMENVLAEGHTIHDKYQRWLWEMGVLWGDWACYDCGHRWGALSPLVCQFCRSPRIHYAELSLRRRNILVEGHADAAVHNLGGFNGLVEIKSIGVGTLRFEAPRLWNLYQDGQAFEEIWWKISRPFTSHLKQGQIYLWLSWPIYEQIVFIYESKAHQAVKEFVVDYNKALIAPLLETAREVTLAVRNGHPPARPAWAEQPDSRICTSCEYRRTCWGIADDTTQAADPTTAVRIRRVPTAQRKRRLQRPT